MRTSLETIEEHYMMLETVYLKYIKELKDTISRQNDIIATQQTELETLKSTTKKVGRKRRGTSQKDKKTLSKINNLLKQGYTDKQIFLTLHMSRSTYYRFKRILKQDGK